MLERASASFFVAMALAPGKAARRSAISPQPPWGRYPPFAQTEEHAAIIRLQLLRMGRSCRCITRAVPSV
jgi:hypothetical protein